MGASHLRLIPWWGLALPAGAAALVGLLVRLAGSGVPDLVGVAALAATAAAAPQVLEDPAHHLLSPVPQGLRRRVGHRLLLFLPVLLVAWVLVAPLVVDGGDSAASVGPLLALTAIGLAGGCLAARVRPELAAAVGTAIPLGVVAIRLAIKDRVARADILDVWIDHPRATAVVAGLVCLVSLHKPGSSGFRPAQDQGRASYGPRPRSFSIGGWIASASPGWVTVGSARWAGRHTGGQQHDRGHHRVVAVGDPANAHGLFPQAAATDALVWSTRDVCAELLAPSRTASSSASR